MTTTDKLIGTDEGTHDHPQTWKIFRSKDGSTYSVKYHTGAPLSRYTVQEAMQQTKGRIRMLDR